MNNPTQSQCGRIRNACFQPETNAYSSKGDYPKPGCGYSGIE